MFASSSRFDSQLACIIKLVVASCAAFAIAFALSACASSNSSQASSSSSAAVENASSSSSSDAADVGRAMPDKMQADPSTATGTQVYVDQDEAVEIAAKNAGLKSSDISLQKREVEMDDGVLVYEIEFLYQNTEYEYTISAETGEILEAESEPIAISQ